MVNQSSYTPFLNDKKRFFKRLNEHNLKHPIHEQKEDLAFAIDRANHQLNKDKSFALLSKNRFWFESEYRDLLAVLKKNDTEYLSIKSEFQLLADKIKQHGDDEAIHARQLELERAQLSNEEERKRLNQSWLLCLYYACLLKAQSIGYGYSASKVDAYQDDIDYLCMSYERAEPKEKDPISWQQQVLQDLDSFVRIPEHVSKMRGWIGLANAYRLLLIFSRFSWQESIVLAREQDWFNNLEKWGMYFDLDRLKGTSATFNVLSVGLFASRFLLNAMVILKHTFVPTGAEEDFKASERFWAELKKRHWILVNDLIWTMVNVLTNYAVYFKISAAAAGWILAGFLVFDALWLGWKFFVEEQAYLAKKQQYNHELQLIAQTIAKKQALLLNAGLTDAEKASLEKSLSDLQNRQLTLTKQLEQLLINRCEINATILFSMAAALLLVVGFSAVILLSVPAIVPISFFLCMIAIAMYLSADKFSDYKKKTFIYQKDKQNQLISASPDAAKQAWNDFVISMVKNTVIPVILMGVYAVSWPAALTLTLIYIAYECSKDYFKRPQAPAKPIPIDVQPDKEQHDEYSRAQYR